MQLFLCFEHFVAALALIGYGSQFYGDPLHRGRGGRYALASVISFLISAELAREAFDYRIGLAFACFAIVAAVWAWICYNSQAKISSRDNPPWELVDTKS